MAFLNNDVINDVRMKANIVDIIGSYIPLTKKGNDYVAVCPFHDDHSPSLHVSESKQIYKCFSCNAAGNVFTFVSNYDDVTFPEAVMTVADKIGYKIDNAPLTFKENRITSKEKEIMDITLKYFQNNLNTALGSEAKEYLKNRGINEEIIEEFQIGLSLDDKDTLYKLLTQKGYQEETLLNMGLINKSDNVYDFFTHRITFPLWDKDGNVVGFSGRIYRGEDAAKYVNSKESVIYKKKDTLYNYHNAKKYVKINSGIIVVEGFMDAIRLSVNNLKNVVALQGTALTKEQTNLLKKLRTNIYLCLDNDDAGIRATLLNGSLLENEGLDVKIITLSDAKDPDEYILKKGIDAFLTNLRNPVDLLTFKLSKLKLGKNLSNSNDLAIYINEVLETLANINDDIKVSVMLNELSRDYNVDINILQKKITELKGLKEIKKEVFTPPPKPKVTEKKSSSDIAIEHILYYMLNDKKYITIYQNKIGYFSKELYRNIANLIVYYFTEKKDINLADFISFIFDKKEEYDKILTITNEFNEELSEETFLEYVNVYLKNQKQEQIKELKDKLKKEMDVNEKMKIANQIAEIKKGVCN